MMKKREHHFITKLVTVRLLCVLWVIQHLI